MSHSSTTSSIPVASPRTFGACNACRRARMRCVNPGQGRGQCNRCNRLDIPCEYIPHRKGSRRSASRNTLTHLTARCSATPDSRHFRHTQAPQYAHTDQRKPCASSPFVVIQSVLGPRSIWVRSHHDSVDALPFPDVLPQWDPVKVGIIRFNDAERLFRRYFQSLLIWAPYIDPQYHSASTIQAQSTLLFSAICAVAAQYCPMSRHVCKPLWEHAIKVAQHVLQGGHRSIYIAAGFAMLANWLPISENSGEDRAWQFVAYAACMVTELGCHVVESLPPGSATFLLQHRRDAARIYLSLYLHDVALSTQLGRPRAMPHDASTNPLPLSEWTIARDDPIARRLLAQVELRQIMDHYSDVDQISESSNHGDGVWLPLLSAWRQHYQPECGLYETFIYSQVELIVHMAAVPESTIGQQEGELPVLGYQSALAMVRDCTQGLEQANFLQYASNLGVVMIVYAAVILFKMICISDPEFIAPQSQDVVSLLRRLSDGMLLAAAFQGTKCSTMQHYGEALSRLLGAPASSTEHASVTESSSAQPPLNFDNFRQLVNLFDLS